MSGKYLENYLADVEICQAFARRSREKMAEIILERTGLTGCEMKARRNDFLCFGSEAEQEEIMFTMPTIDMVATGKNIIRLREAAGLTVKDIQTIFGFASPQAIYKWQHGTAMPTVDNLVILAMILDVTIDEILVVDGNTGAQISA